MWVDYSQFVNIYGADALTSTEFARIIFEAENVVDDLCTGADGFHKLRAVFPTDERGAECVRRAIMAVCKVLKDIEIAEAAAGVVVSGGIAHAGLATSVSSGSESVSFGNADGSQAAQAAKNPVAKRAYLRNAAEMYLRGIKDANGVNLLYGGVYPYVR